MGKFLVPLSRLPLNILLFYVSLPFICLKTSKINLKDFGTQKTFTILHIELKVSYTYICASPAEQKHKSLLFPFV